jgi:ABC-type glycerol-3-phosphate transport system substrate-binding protein
MKKSKNPELAKDFLKWWLGSEGYLRWCLTVPGHLWPSRKDMAESEAFLGNPLLVQNPSVVETVRKLIPVGYTPMTEPNGIVNQAGASGGYKTVIDELAQAVCIGNEDPKQAITAFAAQIRGIIEELRTQYG